MRSNGRSTWASTTRTCRSSKKRPDSFARNVPIWTNTRAGLCCRRGCGRYQPGPHPRHPGRAGNAGLHQPGGGRAGQLHRARRHGAAGVQSLYREDRAFEGYPGENRHAAVVRRNVLDSAFSMDQLPRHWRSTSTVLGMPAPTNAPPAEVLTNTPAQPAGDAGQ